MRITFDPTVAIEEAATEDETRYYMHCVLVDAKASALVATDGHALVKAPCKVDGNDKHDALIPLPAIVAARKAAKKRKTDAEIIVTGGHAEVSDPSGAVAHYPLVNGKFPPYEQIIPAYGAGTPGSCSISFDAELLTQTFRALGACVKGAYVTIAIDAGEGGALSPLTITVSGVDRKGRLGVVAPCKSDGVGYVPKKEEK